jgi:hypothetical protein
MQGHVAPGALQGRRFDERRPNTADAHGAGFTFKPALFMNHMSDQAPQDWPLPYLGNFASLPGALQVSPQV